MKTTATLLLLLSTSVAYGTTKIEFPAKEGQGFKNINQRQEYDYYGHDSEKIWHEFGRPFWRSEAKTTQKEVITQETKETLSSTKTIADKIVAKPTKPLRLDVKFELNKAKIQRNYKGEIDDLGQALKENKDIRVEIQGHTDTTGSKDFNNQLSSSRAKAVKEYLMSKFKIESGRLEAKGFGPSQPQVSNETRTGREQNRRVDIKVLK